MVSLPRQSCFGAQISICKVGSGSCRFCGVHDRGIQWSVCAPSPISSHPFLVHLLQLFVSLSHFLVQSLVARYSYQVTPYRQQYRDSRPVLLIYAP